MEKNLNPKYANNFMLIFAVWQIVLSLLLSAVQLILKIDYTLFSIIVLVFQDIPLFILPIGIYFLATKQRFTDVFHFNNPGLVNIILIIIITILSYPVISLFSAISSSFTEVNVNYQLMALMAYMSTPFAVFIMAVLPGIFEEALCRGIVMSNYKTTNVFIMYFMSGLLFGIMHMNVQQLFYAVPAGMLFAFFAHRTNSILSAMLAHFAVNGLQVVAVKELINTNSVVTTSEPNILSVIMLLAILLPFDILAIYFFVKRTKATANEYMENMKGSNNKFINLGLIGLIVLFAMWQILSYFSRTIIS